MFQYKISTTVSQIYGNQKLGNNMDYIRQGYKTLPQSHILDAAIKESV